MQALSVRRIRELAFSFGFELFIRALLFRMRTLHRRETFSKRDSTSHSNPPNFGLANPSFMRVRIACCLAIAPASTTHSFNDKDKERLDLI
jgi:hypothetical protein